MKTYYFIESFAHFPEATMWLERHIDEIPTDKVLTDAEVVYVNGNWRASVMYVDEQMDMFEEDVD